MAPVPIMHFFLFLRRVSSKTLSTCYQMHHDFEDIEVKSNAPSVLEDALRRKRKKCIIGTGAMCDTKS